MAEDQRSPHPSLQKRLAFGLTLALILVLVGQWLIVSYIIRHVTQEYMASRLAHDAENLLANLDLAQAEGPVLNPARVDTLYTRPLSGHYYLIRSQNRVLRSRSLWDGELEVPQGIFAQGVLVIVAGPGEGSLLSFTRSYYKQRKHVTITVAEDMTILNQGVFVLQIWYGVVSFAAIVLLLLLQRYMVKQALRPLDRAKEEVRRLEMGEVDGLSVEVVPREVVPFVIAINRLLAVLSRRLEQSRHATGNMAHAIKTPLTVLLQLVDSQELAGHPELRGKMVRQIHGIRALTGRELKKVRMAGAEASAVRIDITDALLALVEVMGRVHQERPLRSEIRVPAGLSAIVDREDLLELAGNLLDNACKWATGRWRLTVWCDGALHLMVEDDGPGCAPEHHASILQRGGRVDETMQGQGIGLAVVKEIVDHYGGELELTASDPLKGFCVRVALPLKGLACGVSR
ncbi:MAG: sensor histidine kinase [Magnetococcales bacterium]|nr:sensor histidine kinase [Magnetococcales bacterium]